MSLSQEEKTKINEFLNNLYANIDGNKAKFFIVPALYCLTTIPENEYVYLSNKLKNDFGNELNKKGNVKVFQNQVIEEIYANVFGDTLAGHGGSFNSSHAFSQRFGDSGDISIFLNKYIEYITEKEITGQGAERDGGATKVVYRINPEYYDDFSETIKNFVEV